MSIFTNIQRKLSDLFGQSSAGENRQGPKFIASVLGWTLFGLSVFGVAAALSYVNIAFLLGHSHALMIVFSVVAIIASLMLAFSESLKANVLAFTLMAFSLGFCMAPRLYAVLNAPHGALFVLAAVAITAGMVAGLWLYAKHRVAQGKPIFLSHLMIIGSVIGLIAIGTMAAILQSHWLYIGYCALAVFVFSMFLVTDFCLTIHFAKALDTSSSHGLNCGSEAKEVFAVKLGANIFLDVINLFMSILNLFAASEQKTPHQSDMNAIVKFLMVLLGMVVAPVALIYCAVQENRQEQTPLVSAADGRWSAATSTYRPAARQGDATYTASSNTNGTSSVNGLETFENVALNVPGHG